MSLRVPPPRAGSTGAAQSNSPATSRSSKGLHHAVDVLPLLVALAEDQHEVAGLGIGQRETDRAAAIVLDEGVARAREPAHDLRPMMLAVGSERGLSLVT